MNVIASRRGYFGRLIDVGEVFEVPEGARASWFAPEGGYAPGSEPEPAVAPALTAAVRGRKKADAPEEPAPG